MTDPAEVIRFRVTRTSRHNGQPCPEATEGTYTAHVYCSLPLAKAMTAPNTEWFRNLINQRSAPGGSVADRVDEPCWFVDLPITDLPQFVQTHGSVIIEWESDGPTLEIYDYYRE